MINEEIHQETIFHEEHDSLNPPEINKEEQDVQKS